MKVSKRLVAGLGALLVSASALVQAAPPDRRGGYDDHGPGQHQDHGPQGGPQNNRGNDHRPENHGGGGRPPADFGDVRRTIQEHREIIGRGQPLPPNVHIVKGRPLPHGYGRRLDAARWNTCHATTATNGAASARTSCWSRLAAGSFTKFWMVC